MTIQWGRYGRPSLRKSLQTGPVKRLVIVVLVVLLAAGFYRFYGGEETATGNLTLPQPAPNVGDPAPSFEARRQNGEMFRLSDDGVYVLTFWSVFNKDTAEARPELDELAREYGDEGASFAAVYLSGVPRDEDGDPYAVLQDGRGKLASLYNVKRVPRTFLIEDGRIELVQNGFLPENNEQLEDELARVLEERAHTPEKKKGSA